MKAKLTMYKHIGKLCEPNNGYIKEFNLVSWNNREPVYDIRTWNENHTEWKEGAVITHNEMFKFQKLLTDYLKRDWDKITAFDCEDFEILEFWK